MKLLRWLAAGLLLVLFATASAAEDPTIAKARKNCDAQGEAAGNKAVAETKMQHPGDAIIIKQRATQNERNKCLRAAGMASGPIRAK